MRGLFMLVLAAALHGASPSYGTECHDNDDLDDSVCGSRAMGGDAAASGLSHADSESDVNSR